LQDDGCFSKTKVFGALFRGEGAKDYSIGLLPISVLHFCAIELYYQCKWYATSFLF